MALYDNIYNPLQPSSLYPYYQPPNFIQPQIQPVRSEVVKVNGRNGAEAMALAPNSSALLLDINDPIVWFVSTDGAGYKTCMPYQITPYKAASESSIEDLIAKINARLDIIEKRIRISEPDNVDAKSAADRAEWDL